MASKSGMLYLLWVSVFTKLESGPWSLLWVSNALDVDSLGLVVNCGSNVCWVVSVDKLGLDSESWEEDLELVVCASVEVRGRDDVISGVGKSCNGHELCGLAGRGGNGSNTSLEGSHSLLKDIDRGLEG